MFVLSFLSLLLSIVTHTYPRLIGEIWQAQTFVEMGQPSFPRCWIELQPFQEVLRSHARHQHEPLRYLGRWCLAHLAVLRWTRSISCIKDRSLFVSLQFPVTLRMLLTPDLFARPCRCAAYVQNNGAAFKDAYWGEHFSH